MMTPRTDHPGFPYPPSTHSIHRCHAYHYPHDCQEPGACRTATLTMLANMDARADAEREERTRAGAVQVIWPDDAEWGADVTAVAA